jgi:hypothetical protein
MSPRHPTRRMPSMQGSRIVALAMLAVAVPAASCDKSIVEPNESLPPVEAASVDANAGSWKMIVLTGPDQVVVPDPASVTSPAYLAELQSVKAPTGATRCPTPRIRSPIPFFRSPTRRTQRVRTAT